MIGLIQRVQARPLPRPPRHRRHGLPVRHHLRLQRLERRLRRARPPSALAGRRLSTASVTAALKAAGHIPGPLVFAVDDRDLRAGLARDGLGDALLQRLWRRRRRAHRPGREPLPEALRAARAGHLCAARGSRSEALADDGAALRAAIAADRALRPAEVIAAGSNPTDARASPHLPADRVRDLRQPGLGPPGDPLARASPEPDPAAGLRLRRPAPTLSRPDAYWVPATARRDRAPAPARRADGDARRAAHGRSVEMLRLTDAKPAGRANEGHVAHRRGGGHAASGARRPTPPAPSASRPTSRWATSSCCCWSRNRTRASSPGACSPRSCSASNTSRATPSRRWPSA